MSTNSSTGFRPATSVYMRGQVYVPQVELQAINVEIAALKAENDRLREALTAIIREHEPVKMRDIAKAALAKEV